MPPTALAIVLCFLGGVKSLQTGRLEFDPFNYKNLGGGAPSTFVVGNGLACFEGQARVIEGALALKKAGPRGPMYKDVYARQNSSCASRGYAEISHADACYPGLQRYYRGAPDRRRFQGMETASLTRFAQTFQLRLRSAYVMNACSCHDESELHRHHAEECRHLPASGSYLEHSLDSGEELLCHGGQYIALTRALAVQKSSPNLPMHRSDHVRPVPCANQGFMFPATHLDNCFAQVQTWTREDPARGGRGPDAGAQKAAASEQYLVQGGGFQSFAEVRQLDQSVLGGIEGCQCSPGSPVGRQAGRLCLQPGSSSPIRDWWRD